MKVIKLSVAVLLCLMMVSCSQLTPTDKAIEAYLEKENITNATRTEDGIYYAVVTAGEGPKITPDAHVALNYFGSLLDGKIFDSSYDENYLEFNVSQALKGWQEGLLHFRQGDRGKLILPPEFAFGEREVTGVPPNSVIVYDIHILDVYAKN